MEDKIKVRFENLNEEFGKVRQCIDQELRRGLGVAALEKIAIFCNYKEQEVQRLREFVKYVENKVYILERAPKDELSDRYRVDVTKPRKALNETTNKDSV